MKKYVLAGLVVALAVLLIVVGITPVGAPAPLPADAPATQFSSGRAMALLRQVAAEPRPIGSSGAAAVRRFLIDRLDELKLGPQVRGTGVVSPLNPSVAATVHNVVGAFPAATRRVPCCSSPTTIPCRCRREPATTAWVSSPCSRWRAPCAPVPRRATTSSCCSRTVRRRGLLGARAFLQHDPWAYGVGVVLNFDDPGSSTPSLMYETSPDNGLLVRQFFAARRRPVRVVSHVRGLAAAADHHRLPPLPGGRHPRHELRGPGRARLWHTGYDHDLRTRPGQSAASGGDGPGDDAAVRGRWTFGTCTARRRVLRRRRQRRRRLRPRVGPRHAASAWPCSRPRRPSRRAAACSPREAWPSGCWPAPPRSAPRCCCSPSIWGMYRSAYEQRVWTETGVVISDLLPARPRAARDRRGAGVLRRRAAAAASLGPRCGGALVVGGCGPSS